MVKRTNFSTGFTLIEMLVVVGIISLFSLLTFVSYPKVSAFKNLDRASQEIVLALRKAQNFALGTKKFDPSGTYPAYGVYFDSRGNQSYLLFADANNNKEYSGAAEKLEEYTISGPAVFELCLFLKTALADECSLRELDIVFASSTAVWIDGTRGDGTHIYAAGNDAEVKISLPDGTFKTVVIWSDTGQIYVE